VIGDAAEDVGQPCLRIDAVEFGRLDQGVGNGRRLAATLGADKEIFFRPIAAGWIGLCGIAFLAFISVSQNIVVTPSMITSYTRTPIGNFGRKSMPLNDIHSVMWAGNRMFTGKNTGYLCLASYGTEISIPMNLEPANWIGRIVMTAAAGKLPKH
jgi:hypothetical protein